MYAWSDSISTSYPLPHQPKTLEGSSSVVENHLVSFQNWIVHTESRQFVLEVETLLQKWFIGTPQFFRGVSKYHPFLQIGRSIWAAPENRFVGAVHPLSRPYKRAPFSEAGLGGCNPPLKMDFVGGGSSPYPSLKISIKIWAPSSSSWAGYSGHSVRSIRMCTRSIRVFSIY